MNMGVGLIKIRFKQQKDDREMAIIVKGEITITKGFDTWRTRDAVIALLRHQS